MISLYYFPLIQTLGAKSTVENLTLTLRVFLKPV